MKTIEKTIPIWYIDLTGIVWIRYDFMVVRWPCNGQSVESSSLWNDTSEWLEVLSDSAESDVISSYGSVSDAWNIVSVGVFDVSAVAVLGESDGEVWPVDNSVVILWDVEKSLAVCGA